MLLTYLHEKVDNLYFPGTHSILMSNSQFYFKFFNTSFEIIFVDKASSSKSPALGWFNIFVIHII